MAIGIIPPRRIEQAAREVAHSVERTAINSDAVTR